MSKGYLSQKASSKRSSSDSSASESPKKQKLDRYVQPSLTDSSEIPSSSSEASSPQRPIKRLKLKNIPENLKHIFVENLSTEKVFTSSPTQNEVIDLTPGMVIVGTQETPATDSSNSPRKSPQPSSPRSPKKSSRPSSPKSHQKSPRPSPPRSPEPSSPKSPPKSPRKSPQPSPPKSPLLDSSLIPPHTEELQEVNSLPNSPKSLVDTPAEIELDTQPNDSTSMLDETSTSHLQTPDYTPDTPVPPTLYKRENPETGTVVYLASSAWGTSSWD